MKNAHGRIGELVYIRHSEKTRTHLRVHLSAWIGEESKAHRQHAGWQLDVAAVECHLVGSRPDGRLRAAAGDQQGRRTGPQSSMSSKSWRASRGTRPPCGERNCHLAPGSPTKMWLTMCKL